MKRILALGAVIMTIVAFSSCEKDDICVDGDTPLLVIGFYDVNDTTAAKKVTKLRVAGENQQFTVNTVADRTDLDLIEIPLRINSPNTSFVLISNSATNSSNEETGNADIVTFNYDTNEVFVSRACGFIANYENLSGTLGSDSDHWIQGVEIVKTTINDQAAAHVKIYH
ncbi:DUF6452 family protein [Sediminicola sp. 1XM1-17]|uniref:DUF6452 family protein n=1 Tax=Sediminicola sp. 1XM1-17 TaxID=3127702 RepID=UPI00307727DB